MGKDNYRDDVDELIRAENMAKIMEEEMEKAHPRPQGTPNPNCPFDGKECPTPGKGCEGVYGSTSGELEKTFWRCPRFPY